MFDPCRFNRYEDYPERCQNCYYLSPIGFSEGRGWFDCYAHVAPVPENDSDCGCFKKRSEKEYQAVKWE